MNKRSPTTALALTSFLALGLSACDGGDGGIGGGGTDTVTGVTLSCAASTVKVGETTTCTATVQTASGAVTRSVLSQSALTPQATTVTFNSSNPANATISAAGVVTGVAAGSTSITATAGGVTSNAVSMSVTSSNSPAPSGTTIIYDASTAQYTLPFYHATIRPDGLVAYTVLEGSGVSVYVYENGQSSKVHVAPNTAPLSIFGKMCLDRVGNLVLPVSSKAHYLDRASGTLTAIPFPQVDGESVQQVACSSDGKIVGSETDFGDDAEYSYAWTPGQAQATALPVVHNGCIGCNVRGANPAGDVLFYNGLIRGGSVSYFPSQPNNPEGFNGGALEDDGTVWGTSFTNTANPTKLTKWTASGLQTVFGLPVPADAVQSTAQWWVMDANTAGEVLLGRQYSSSTNNIYHIDHFVYRNGTLLPLTPPAKYQPKEEGTTVRSLIAYGIDDQGRVLVQLTQPDNLFGGAFALMKP